MRKSLVIGLIILAVLIGSGYWFINRNKSSDSADSQSSNSLTDKKGNKFQTESTLSSLSNGGESRKCDISYSGAKGDANGLVYTDGKGRIRADVDYNPAEGKTGTASTLITKSKAYFWLTSEGKSYGFSFSTSMLNDSNSRSTVKNSGGISPDDKVMMNCEKWKIDESVMVPPKNVNFIALPNS